VFENKVRRIFGPKRDEVTRGWRKLHNEEFRGNAYRLLVGKSEGKRPLGRPRRRSVDDVKMDLLEIGWGSVDWIGLAHDRDKWRSLDNVVVITCAVLSCLGRWNKRMILLNM
jgi:hypothetical protein